MKQAVKLFAACALLFLSINLYAQNGGAGTVKTQSAPATKVDKGSEGAITMEEYEMLHAEFQKKNPGKTFQNLKKEEFETYLTTELAKLRQRRAEEVKQQQASPQLKPAPQNTTVKPKETNTPY